MSLRDKVRGGALVPVLNGTEEPKTLSLRRAVSQAVAAPSGRGLEALKKISSIPTQSGFIRFVIDATGSREDNWPVAQRAQESMFSSVSGLGSMTLRLIHYGGSTLTDKGWFKNAESASAAMKEVKCQSGLTKIVPSLELCIDNKSGSVIVIGDSFEEDIEDLQKIAVRLKEKNIKVFTFLEGHCSDAEIAFRQLAELTGGTFARFGEDISLKDLCEGVALMTVVGPQALARLRNSQARALLSAPK